MVTCAAWEWGLPPTAKVPWLPLLPAPFLAESFGSWLRRCAEAYATTESTFANAILALDDMPPCAACEDWEIAPHPPLLESLGRHSAYRLPELQQLVVSPSPALLAPAQRDAYCPECLTDDQRKSVYYTRRCWLDAWTIWCPLHRCLMGEFEGPECEADIKTERVPLDLQFGNRFTRVRQAIRVRPTVSAVRAPCRLSGKLLARLDAMWADRWFDPTMLQGIVGRDLMMFMGSASGDALVYELFGISRSWYGVWHDSDRRALSVENVHHPLGGIKVRILAAFLANLVWRHLYSPHDAAVRRRNGELLKVLRDWNSTGLGRVWLDSKICRWPRADQKRWMQLFRP